MRYSRLAIGVLMTTLSLRAEAADILTFPEMCDASAAIALDEKTIIVGDDEGNHLWIYDIQPPAFREKKSIKVKRLPPCAGSQNDEADLEGATVFEDHIVWISSHGRNKKGQVCPNRSNLFASHKLNEKDGTFSKAAPYSFNNLLSLILATTDSDFAPLRQSIGDLSKTDPNLEPKSNGFNIEGLATARDGKTLLIGIRNPQEKGRAFLLQLKGFAHFLNHDGDESKLALGPLILLDLGGRGVRDIAWSPAHKSYLIIAGQAKDSNPGPGFALYKWDGTSDPVQIGDFKDIDQFHAEAVVPLLDRTASGLVPSKRVLFLSDDGKVNAPGVSCKDKKQFRGVIRTLD